VINKLNVLGDSESRGISGGEKKRVNIGIELVSGILQTDRYLSKFRS
jgi:ABC-type multidrug transport system ATPase subunit